MRRLILLIVLNLGFVDELPAQNFCNAPLNDTATIELVSPPYGGLPVLLRLSEYYGSGGSLGAPQVTVVGDRIEITQSNAVLWAQPFMACRVLTVNAGQLSPGHYRVTWTTVEEQFPRLEPPTRTRVRHFEFTLLPIGMIPAAEDHVLVLLALALAGFALARLPHSRP